MNDKTIRLKDGRTLAYTEHGDLGGKPVFFVHGNPGSRYMRHPDETIATELGLKIITPDRPGYGFSDFQPNRTLMDYPDDIAQLADSLSIEQFYMFGVSAGGPYVAATAFKLPERVLRGAIVSGAAPFDRADALEGVSNTYRIAYESSTQPAWLLRVLMAMQMRGERRDPEKSWSQILDRASPADRELLSQPEFAEQVKAYRPEAVRNGVKGWVQEAKILVASWGFPLRAVQPEIDLWYGEQDSIVPPQMGHYLDETIPNTNWYFVRDAGHFLIFMKWRDILEALIA
ncbi:MAG: alpha/beta hydrolase [Aggregatilineales bacterium]